MDGVRPCQSGRRTCGHSSAAISSRHYRRCYMNWYERATGTFASSRPGAWFFVNVAMRLDRVLIPLTRGRLSSCLGTRYHRRHLLLLTTIGAKSGRPRTVPLLYFADGADLVVIGSKG